MMHRGFTLVWSLIFAVSPFWVSAEPIQRPMEEMRGGCSDHALNLRTELDAIGGPRLAWSEVLGKYERMEPIQFEMQMGCSKLFKTISYRLQGELVVRVPGKTPADYPPAQQSRKEIELEANLNRVIGDIADSIGGYARAATVRSCRRSEAT